MKTSMFTVTILLALQLTTCSYIPKKIYEINAETDSRKCYTCQDSCISPELVDCLGDDKCFSKVSRTSSNSTIATKGCVESSLAGTICEDGEITSCYTCDGDFCNSDTPDLGVSKCYVCIDRCTNPPEEHYCQEVLSGTLGEPVKAGCLSYETKTEDGISVSKGCVPDNTDIRNTCYSTNLLYESITCSICDSDLCNTEEDEEKFVEQCYFCSNTCEPPLPIQNCREELGEGAKSKCGIIDYTPGDGDRVVARGCVDVSDPSIESTCQMINLVGGTCTLCDTDLCNNISSSQRIYSIIYVPVLISLLIKLL